MHLSNKLEMTATKACPEKKCIAVLVMVEIVVLATSTSLVVHQAK